MAEDWSDAELLLHVLAVSGDDQVAGEVWVSLPDGVDAFNVESVVMATFGQPDEPALQRLDDQEVITVGWYFPGDRLAPHGLPAAGNAALVIPSYVTREGEVTPMYVANAQIQRRARELADKFGLELHVVRPTSDEEQPSGDPLDVVGRALGDQGLDGALRVVLRSEGTIDTSTVSIGEDGGLVVVESTRDGMSSRLEDVWTVDPTSTPLLLESLARELFPNGLPLAGQPDEVSHEILLRLTRARFVGAGSVVRWLDELGVPTTHRSEYR